MYRVQTFNSISDKGLTRFTAERYTVSPDTENADAILLRSHKLAPTALTPNLRAVARAGAGVVQQIPLSGAVIVSTPQDVALADARKGVGMFRLEELKVPVLGMVENMAYFVPDDMPDKKYHIVGRDGVKRLADSLDAPFLGELPLLQTIREAGDAGRPAALQTSGDAAAAFRAVVANLLKQLGKDV